MIDNIFLKFLVVGTINTFLSVIFMFVFYHFFTAGYWLSSLIGYVAGSILSFFLNKIFTFQKAQPSKIFLRKFILNMIACYCVAYSVAQPIVRCFFNLFVLDTQAIEQISMIIGIVIFTLLNYVMQKRWVFR